MGLGARTCRGCATSARISRRWRRARRSPSSCSPQLLRLAPRRLPQPARGLQRGRRGWRRSPCSASPKRMSGERARHEFRPAPPCRRRPASWCSRWRSSRRLGATSRSSASRPTASPPAPSARSPSSRCSARACACCASTSARRCSRFRRPARSPRCSRPFALAIGRPDAVAHRYALQQAHRRGRHALAAAGGVLRADGDRLDAPVRRARRPVRRGLRHVAVHPADDRLVQRAGAVGGAHARPHRRAARAGRGAGRRAARMAAGDARQHRRRRHRHRRRRGACAFSTPRRSA